MAYPCVRADSPGVARCPACPNSVPPGLPLNTNVSMHGDFIATHTNDGKATRSAHHACCQWNRHSGSGVALCAGTIDPLWIDVSARRRSSRRVRHYRIFRGAPAPRSTLEFCPPSRLVRLYRWAFDRCIAFNRCTLTIHSSRSYFAARLNSDVTSREKRKTTDDS